MRSCKAHTVWHSRQSTSIRVERVIEYSVSRCEFPIFRIQNHKLAELLGRRPAFIVSDERVAALYGNQWTAYSRHHLALTGELRLALNERTKKLATVEHICDSAQAAGLPRNGIFVAIGGGTTLDTVGFAAAIYRRGIGYVRIPTTLVGLCDAGVGVKQAVNASGKKNLLGAFYPPIASINDYHFLATLSDAEIAAGMAEIAKIALVRDAILFDAIEANADELLRSRFQSPRAVAHDIVLRAELLMMQELAPNLFEEQLARLVDFGHTFSPIIESSSNYEIQHGNAVALDMLLSVAISIGRGLADIELLQRLTAFFERIGFSADDARMCGTDKLCQAVEETRRHRAGSLNLVVLRDAGSPVFLNDVTPDDIGPALNRMRTLDASARRPPIERTLRLVRSAV